MTTASETTFCCPNCGGQVVATVPGEAKCPGGDCPYSFKVFSKREHEAAEEFYLAQPSKRLKYLRQAPDGRWFVAYCEKVEPFITDNDIERATRQLRSYMFVATMGTDSEEYRFEKPINIGSLLKQLIDDFEYAAEMRGISIEPEIKEEMPPANFDRDKLQIALANLFDNAVKYSHRDRTIKVGASFDKDHDVFTIFISDFGLGIPDTELESIFEKFHRSRVKDPRRFIPGTGIGLAMVKQIVSKHGGKVWASLRAVDSKAACSTTEDFNTTFWIQLHRHRKALL